MRTHKETCRRAFPRLLRSKHTCRGSGSWRVHYRLREVPRTVTRSSGRPPSRKRNETPKVSGNVHAVTTVVEAGVVLGCSVVWDPLSTQVDGRQSGSIHRFEVRQMSGRPTSQSRGSGKVCQGGLRGKGFFRKCLTSPGTFGRLQTVDGLREEGYLGTDKGNSGFRSVFRGVSYKAENKDPPSAVHQPYPRVNNYFTRFIGLRNRRGRRTVSERRTGHRGLPPLPGTLLLTPLGGPLCTKTGNHSVRC